MKNEDKNLFYNCIRIFLIIWFIVIGYGYLFAGTKFGLENFLDEDSVLYIDLITMPYIFLLSFLITGIIIANTAKIKSLPSPVGRRFR